MRTRSFRPGTPRGHFGRGSPSSLLCDGSYPRPWPLAPRPARTPAPPRHQLRRRCQVPRPVFFLARTNGDHLRTLVVHGALTETPSRSPEW